MGDYISNHSGPDIDNAIAAVLAKPILDNTSSIYAVGYPTTDTNYNIFKKSGIIFSNAGDIACNTLTTNGDILVKPDGTYSTEGGQINFYNPSNEKVGFVDTHLNSSGIWYMRICKEGQAFINVNLVYGNTTITNLNNNNSWIYCAQNAAIWSNKASVGGATGHLGMKTQAGRWALCTYNNERLDFVYCTDTNVNNNNNVASANIQFGENGKIYGSGGWGDYAELRTCIKNQPGRCVYEKGDGSLEITSERLMRGSHIISDTYGMLIGPEGDKQVAVGVSGRVLAYIHEGREKASKHIGWPVCSGPNGTVSIMTEEEEQKYPSRIIGTISEIPTYEEWGEDKIKVNGRIWIHLK